MSPIYTLSAAVGSALVVYAYGFRFDSMSETELLEFGPIWLLPLAFGLYGLAAEKALAMVDRGEAENLAIATMILAHATRLLGLIPLLPFLFVTTRKSHIVAVAALGFWAVVYLLITKCFWHLL